ncbi:CRE-PQN-72 protein [Caenorhabditis remanei]|uniref:CRE-PQN-72 protein n=1 Tax=Caenorhabditis remanei TaxID=31234 RepID=E3LM44_CAERE|nr:CRE-PQN-72 protein [Caenorhabditis remanei]
MPFGSVQRTPSSSIRRPSNRLSVRPPLPPPTTHQTLTTTTPIPSTSSSSPSTFPPIPTTTQPVSLPSSTHVATIHSVGGSLRRPIRVQQLQLNLRRKPQMTRGQFRRPQSNSKFPLTRHQPTHRVTKPDRVTRPIVSTTNEPITTTTEEEISLTVAGTTPEGIQRQSSNLKQVDDIEAAILQAVIESSSPEPPPSTTRRQRIHRIRPGHRHRPAPPPRVDAIEEAVLRAVLEATPSAPIPEEVTSTTEGTTTTTAKIEEPIETTTLKTESTSLFPAFASRRHGHRRPTTVIPPTPEMTTESTVIITEPTTEPTTTTTIPEETTTSAEESTTSVTEGTTTEQVTDITIALPEDDFEDINAKISTEDHQLHQIEDNVISALSTQTSTASSSPTPPSPLPSTLPSSPSPPSPPAPPTEFNLQQAGPPGSMPPSDDIVDELNDSSDFLQVAQRLHLLRRLLQ